MGKYYYANLVNSFGQIFKVANIKSLGSYEPPAIFLRYVIEKKQIEETKGLFGIKTTVEKKYYTEFPMLFEQEEEGYLTDIITGHKYQISKKNIEDKNKPTIILSISKEILPSELVNSLKRLSNEDIERYKYAVDSLEKQINYGYMEYTQEEQRKAEILRQDEQFIEQFKKIYGNR